MFSTGSFLNPSTELDETSSAALNQAWNAPEPFAFLHDYQTNGLPSVPDSPDPLVSMTWSPSVNTSELQLYRVTQPLHLFQVEDGNATPEHSLIPLFPPNGTATFVVSQNNTFLLDWGVERAAWFEVSVHQGKDSGNYALDGSLSEYREPYPGKARRLVRYDAGPMSSSMDAVTYRLETNQELYEGIRYTFLTVSFLDDDTVGRTSTTTTSLTLKCSLVAMIKPISYKGSFSSSNSALTTVWYTGAYAVRLNMQQDTFQTVLVERGDRVPIQGDGYPTVDTALVAFSPYDFIKGYLQQTNSGNHSVVDDNIMAYPLYWCLSALDYVMESGDVATFHELLDDIQKLLDRRIEDFLSPTLDITWFGWDDRVGSGWCFHSKKDMCPREAHLAFAGLVIHVCNQLTSMLQYVASMTDDPTYSTLYLHYKHVASTLKQRLRQVPEWPHGFGVHAAANAIHARVPTTKEMDHWTKTTLNDAVTICSFSPFNQYWILRALGIANRMEHALASIQLCWAPMATSLGKGCFWEVFSPEWTEWMKDGDKAPHLPSYCHPWSSGVTAWFTHHVGGIQPLLPGYEEVLIAPYVSPTYPVANVSLTSPRGVIRVHASLSSVSEEEGDCEMRVSVQSPVSGFVGIRSELAPWAPDDSSSWRYQYHTVYLNQNEATMVTFEELQEELGYKARTSLESHLIFVRLQPGSHELLVRYWDSASRTHSLAKRMTRETEERPPYYPFPPRYYPASLSVLDDTRQGDGLYFHGRDGYLLIGCDHGKDISKLPEYISTVRIRRHGFPGWLELNRTFVGGSESNPIFLPLPRPSSQQIMVTKESRGLGMVGLEDAGGGDINCIIVDIVVPSDLKLQHNFYVSLYMVAPRVVNRHAIRVMDGQSFNVIAPSTFISNYTEGLWWTVQYNQSLRLRLLDLQGMHISAIGFRRSDEANLAM
eukprot:Nitzschia sp. Nitz4//scaffold302_size22357//13327//16265//NITZ4_008560-RA/size22357-snap-gene-0.8-mRNA-1//1//CDS//3329547035//2203//frame0